MSTGKNNNQPSNNNDEDYSHSRSRSRSRSPYEEPEEEEEDEDEQYEEGHNEEYDQEEEDEYEEGNQDLPDQQQPYEEISQIKSQISSQQNFKKNEQMNQKQPQVTQASGSIQRKPIDDHQAEERFSYFKPNSKFHPRNNASPQKGQNQIIMNQQGNQQGNFRGNQQNSQNNHNFNPNTINQSGVHFQETEMLDSHTEFLDYNSTDGYQQSVDLDQPNQMFPNPPMYMPMMNMNSMQSGQSAQNYMHGHQGVIVKTILEQKLEDQVEELELKILDLNNDLEAETENSKILEGKCEEFLTQLQRSADIIENNREKFRLEAENYDHRLDRAEQIIQDEKDKVFELEGINKRLNLEIDDLRNNQQQNSLQQINLQGSIEENQIRYERSLRDLQEKDEMLKEKVLEIQRLKDDVLDRQDELDGLKRFIEQSKQNTQKMEIDFQRAELEVENKNRRIEDLSFKMEDYLRDLDEEKIEKNKLYKKVDDKQFEIDQLKQENYMLKRMMVDLEKKEYEIQALKQQQDEFNRQQQMQKHQRDQQRTPISPSHEFQANESSHGLERSSYQRDIERERESRRREKQRDVEFHSGSRYASKDTEAPRVNNFIDNSQRGGQQSDLNIYERQTQARPSQKQNITHALPQQQDQERVRGASQRRMVNASNSNILTWNQPYNSIEDQIEKRKVDKNQDRIDKLRHVATIEAQVSFTPQDYSNRAPRAESNSGANGRRQPRGVYDQSPEDSPYIDHDDSHRNIYQYNQPVQQERRGRHQTSQGNLNNLPPRREFEVSQDQQGDQGHMRRARVDRIPKRGQPVQATAIPGDDELTAKQKSKKDTEDYLLQLNVQRDQLNADLRRLDQQKKKTGESIRRRKELEEELEIMQKSIGSVKHKLRAFK